MADEEKRSIARWNPFEDLGWWFPSVSRASDGDSLESFWGRRGSGELSPATDLTEDDGHYIVSAELPGMKRNEISVDVHDGVRMIRGEKKSEREQQSEKRRYVERRFGSFSRAFTLPSDADDTQVEASFKHGVLTVTLAKTEARKARAIAVKAA